MIITWKKGKGKEREAPTQMIRISNSKFPTGVTLLFLDANGMLEFTVLRHYMYSHASAFV